MSTWLLMSDVRFPGEQQYSTENKVVCGHRRKYHGLPLSAPQLSLPVSFEVGMILRPRCPPESECGSHGNLNWRLKWVSIYATRDKVGLVRAH